MLIFSLAIDGHSRVAWPKINEQLAGLGQLLRDKKLKLEVKEELLKVPDPWMLEPIKALLAEYEL